MAGESLDFRIRLACLVSSLPYRKSFFRRGGFKTFGTDLQYWPARIESWFGSHLLSEGQAAYRRLMSSATFQDALPYLVLAFPGEQEYPSNLAQIFDPPGALWILSTDSTKQKSFASNLPYIGIVGTRRPDPISIVAVERFLDSVSAVVVSGLALGVDAAAHARALERNQPTLAVLGAGVLHPGPSRNSHLWRASPSVTLVSEFLPDIPPKNYHFPRRNRIIAGLSDALFLFQAPRKSGALISAEYALEEGRDLYVFDHPMLSDATNGGGRDLLQQGAMPVGLPELEEKGRFYRWPAGPVEPEKELWLRRGLRTGRLRPLGQGWLFDGA